MLPSITAMPSLLLMTCFIGAVSTAGEGNANQMLQTVVLPETTMDDPGVIAREVIKMTLFNWMYNEAENATHLTICAKELLLASGDVKKTNPTLVYKMDEQNQTNIEGEVLDGNLSCSLFTQDGKVPLAKSDTLYQLSLIVTNSENNTILRSGSAKFEMSVETSTLYCHGKPYTRASGLTSSLTFHNDHPCIKDDLKLRNDGVCYLEGEFSSDNLCYTTDATDFQVCLQGSSPATANEEDGLLAIRYLAYHGVDKHPADAHLSMKFDGHKPTGRIEALIWMPDMSFATSCQFTRCPITDFTPGFTHYDVCAVTLVNGLPVKTSTSSITDLNAHAFAYNEDSSLLQFDYTNANEYRYYVASVVNHADENVTRVDCSAVPLDGTCHGYFEEKCTDDLIVAVEYADAKLGATGNKILFPC